MGICTAIGYTMSVSDFYQHVRLPIGRNGSIEDQLYKCLHGTDFLHWNRREGLVRQPDSDGPSAVSCATGLAHLFEIVNNDTEKHIMLFPTITDKKKWFRYVDAMDSIFAITNERFTRGQMTYLDVPFYPYGVYMDRNGVAVDPPLLGSDPAIIPGIPNVMRWWLTRYEIFDLSGIAKLRPMAAEWWG